MGSNGKQSFKICTINSEKNLKKLVPITFQNPKMTSKLTQILTVHRGDICQLPNIQVIVNAANTRLQGGAGVDGAIHRSAGPDLRKECAELYPNGCNTSDACPTNSFNLKHAKSIIHTVGPIVRSKTPEDNHKKALSACYVNCLNAAHQKFGENFESIAFPCISTGVYGYPQRDAAELVVRTCLEWLKENDGKVGVREIMFCCFMPEDEMFYRKFISEAE